MEKYSYEYMVALGRQHLLVSACLRCRTPVDALLCVLYCYVQGRLQAVLLCRRYVILWLSELGFCLRGVHRRNKFQNNKAKKQKSTTTKKKENKSSLQIDREKQKSPSAINS